MYSFLNGLSGQATLQRSMEGIAITILEKDGYNFHIRLSVSIGKDNISV